MKDATSKLLELEADSSETVVVKSGPPGPLVLSNVPPGESTSDSSMCIRNWHEFQHFKNRCPPWIKLHRRMLDQRDIMTLSPEAFRFLVCLWLMASEDKAMKGTLPSESDISFRLRISESKCCDLLKQVDIFLISEGYHTDAPETEESRVETEKKPYGELGRVLLTDEEYSKLQERNDEARLRSAIEILDGYIASKNKKYASHYAVLKEGSWVWDRVNERQPATRRNMI